LLDRLVFNQTNAIVVLETGLEETLSVVVVLGNFKFSHFPTIWICIYCYISYNSG
jgi:hypothetical protein